MVQLLPARLVGDHIFDGVGIEIFYWVRALVLDWGMVQLFPAILVGDQIFDRAGVLVVVGGSSSCDF